jgi:hypothetical protein
MKAQRVLLRELRKEFGGSAKAFGTTLPGAFAKFHNAVDEVTGAFAEGLAPIVQRVANLLSNKMADPKFMARVRELGRVVGVRLMKAFANLSAWFQEHWPQIMTFINTFNAALKRTAAIIEGVAHWWNKISGAYKKVVGSNEGINNALKMEILRKTEGHPGARAAAMEKYGFTNGVNVHGDIHVHGVQDPKRLAETVHRHSKKHASRTRGIQQTPLLGHK